MTRENDALVLYLGGGSLPYPQPSPEVLVETYGLEEGSDLVQYAAGIVDELSAVKPDWDAEDLISATERAVGLVASRHPELGDQALRLLREMYSFGYR
jgi:hypothetical protein